MVESVSGRRRPLGDRGRDIEPEFTPTPADLPGGALGAFAGPQATDIEQEQSPALAQGMGAGVGTLGMLGARLEVGNGAPQRSPGSSVEVEFLLDGGGFALALGGLAPPGVSGDSPLAGEVVEESADDPCV